MKKLFIFCSSLLIFVSITKKHGSSSNVVAVVNEKEHIGLTKQLLELLDYSKDGFKAIKGNVNKELTEKNKITGNTYYKTSITLDGEIENHIKESGSSKSLSFKAYFGKDLSMAEGNDLFKKLHEQIKEYFTNGFVIKKDFENYEGDLYETVMVRRDNDRSHYIELTLLNADDIMGNRIEVYITVE